MKKRSLILAIALIVASLIIAFIVGKRTHQQIETINAPELSGLGSVHIGMTTSETVDVLEENNTSFNMKTSIEDAKYSLRFMKARPDEVEDYEEKDATYYLREDMKLSLRLGFYRDSLVIIRIIGRWSSDGANTVREAFKTKYGDGVIMGNEKYGYGLTETWKSDKVKAVYFLQDDKNSNPNQRKILEYVMITPAGRDIAKELSEYDKIIAEQKDAQKKAIYDNL